MLLKEKLFLSNCDSTRKLRQSDIRWRVLIGALFADGVVFSPNLLIDNPGIAALIHDKALHDWFTHDEGAGRVEVRGFGLAPGQPLVDYFQKLPDGYIMSRLGGRHKGEMQPDEYDQICRELERTQQALARYGARTTPLEADQQALTTEIQTQLAFSGAERDINAVASHRATLERVLACSEALPVSRSDWYQRVNALSLSSHEARAFRLEVIDSAYNRLFVAPGEAFVLDDIPGLERVPGWMLDSGLCIRRLRRERQLLGYAWQLFNLISSLGSEGIMRVLLDEALNYAEDQAHNRGLQWCQRRNWFGLYPRLTRIMGVELKS